MCGLVGAVGRSMAPLVEPEAGARALACLRHRGPDDQGVESGDGWWLGFRRLSILDLSEAGHQPMFSPQRDAVLLLNGEIYNFLELRRQLEASGERFQSSGDAEVLLRLLRRDGREALHRLNGMFAFAFLDLRSRRFLIARDRLGVKPLYFSKLGGVLRFASELPALLALLPSRPLIDRLALARYLALGHIAAPLTIWEGVSKLEPGAAFEGNLEDAASARATHWWTLRAEPDQEPTRREWLERIDALLADATRQRLVSDVPVGLFLSGGIDSGLVAHYAGMQQRPPRALVADFAERGYSEGGLAAATAAHLGLDFQRVNVESGSLDDLGAIAWHCGEPFADSSIVNQYTLARAARPHATVYLTGDGGDEAFGGYNEYVRMSRLGPLARVLAAGGKGMAALLGGTLSIDSPLRQRLSKLSGGPEGFGALVRQNFRDPVVSRLMRRDWRVEHDRVEAQMWSTWARSAGLPLMSRLQQLDYVQYLEPDVLTKVDRATMAWSIEARSPFLDYRVVEMAARIPARFHVDHGAGKSLLRELAARYLPPAVVSQPKRGFGLPVRSWLASGLLPHVRTLIHARPREWWEPSALNEIFAAYDRGRRDLADVIWRILMLEMWARVHLDEEHSRAA